MNTKSSGSNRVVNLEKQKARESWHKLVVKILSWKDGSNSVEKITSKEWKTYCQHTLEKNVTYGKQRTQDELKKTKEIIESYDGFVK